MHIGVAHNAMIGSLRFRSQPSIFTLPHRQQPAKVPRDVQAANNIGDDMMDFIQAGPKLRKWYGETDKLIMPKDGGPEGGEEEDDEPVGPREAIVVVGAESELGQLVVMELVLLRAEVRVLVKDKERTQKEFGPYVKAVKGDVNTGSSLKKVMKGAKSVIICGPVGQSARAAAALGLTHIVLPSALAPTGFSLGSVFGNPESSMQDESREEEVMGGPVPYTVVRFEPLLDQMGGQCGIELYQGEGAPAGGKLTREDAAIVIARAAENPPGPSAGAVFVATASAAAAPSSEDWEAKFAQLDTSLLQAAPKPA